MDVDMIKSSASTAVDHHRHHQQHHLDMMTIMMQMEKPNCPDHHQFCDDPYHNTSQLPNSATFLDINFSGDSRPPPAMFHSPNNTSSSSSPPATLNPTFIGFINNPIQEPIMNNNNNNVVVSAGRLFKNNMSAIAGNAYEKRNNSMAAMREMIFRIAAMQPIHIDPESIKPPKRRNVKISKDPQSVAARHRRERISERIRILQRLVPGGTKMDTASMLDEAIHYVKFLKKQVQTLEQAGANRPRNGAAGAVGFPVPAEAQLAAGSHVNYSSFLKASATNCQPNIVNNVPMVETMHILR